MYTPPVVGGTGTVLGATTGAVLANTGSSSIVAIAAGAAIIMAAWGLALVRSNQ